MPKKRMMGIMAMTPMSPNTFCIRGLELKHHRIMVARVVNEMNHCTPENLSLTGRMGTMLVPLLGWNVTRSRIQMRTMEMIPTGRAMKNHVSQDGSGSIIWRATMFCGDAIGESMPPMLEARAIPRMSALDIWESEGRLRSIGYWN